MNEIIIELTKNNIKPSIHRIKILEYLRDNRTHPTVDEIYLNLKEGCPTLSRATVYNTLSLFVQSGIVRPLTIEDREIRYDYNTEDHGHFKCEQCGFLSDFEVNVAQLKYEGLEHHEITNKDVYFRGVCNKCLGNKKS
ncbi:MAG: Fur family transcriptional regulator [Clostridia bacterium]|jgi:Fur family peroxide stress response transcriptional regulator|nr:transcriptional repressor [Clostridiaceae bacterium]